MPFKESLLTIPSPLATNVCVCVCVCNAIYCHIGIKANHYTYLVLSSRASPENS